MGIPLRPVVHNFETLLAIAGPAEDLEVVRVMSPTVIQGLYVVENESPGLRTAGHAGTSEEVIHQLPVGLGDAPAGGDSFPEPTPPDSSGLLGLRSSLASSHGAPVRKVRGPSDGSERHKNRGRRGSDKLDLSKLDEDAAAFLRIAHDAFSKAKTEKTLTIAWLRCAKSAKDEYSYRMGSHE